MLHVNLHLERMADYCVTIAKLDEARATGSRPTRLLVEGFEEMGARAEEMIRVALDSFAKRDVERAESLVDLDELIDRANRRVVGHVLALGADPELREWGLRMILVSRCLERIGDHAVDIGEQTAYLVTGEFREFTDASHPRGRVGLASSSASRARARAGCISSSLRSRPAGSQAVPSARDRSSSPPSRSRRASRRRPHA